MSEEWKIDSATGVGRLPFRGICKERPMKVVEEGAVRDSHDARKCSGRSGEMGLES